MGRAKTAGCNGYAVVRGRILQGAKVHTIANYWAKEKKKSPLAVYSLVLYWILRCS